MITCTCISEAVFIAKSCLKNLAAEYVDATNYGYSDKDDIAIKMETLESYLRILKDYDVDPSVKYASVKFSPKGRFSLDSVQNLISLDGILTINPDSVNCLTEDEICEIISKIKTLCPNCL